MKLHKSAADYAAIAVAPVLIFLMISALANHFVMMLYDGGFPDRVAWTLLMFTMGSVAIARIAIEQNRAYSLGYAVALGTATFVVMIRFVGAPLFCAFILVVIAYLADVIVRDCTIIDDDLDASGEGLIDAGRMFVKNQIVEHQENGDANARAPDEAGRKSRPTHQPGRTVMYLAFGALPLFGLGQFMLRGDSGSWTRAQTFLGLYLFAALALLVTTSFLGLRRYLRQRGAEMPRDVVISWLGGGIAIIAAVLLIAYLVPLPGRALASIELPKLVSSSSGRLASQFGWGDEGADNSKPNAATTKHDTTTQGKERHNETFQEGGQAGEVANGNRDDGPSGTQDGGKQQSAGANGDSSGQSKASNSDQSNSGQKGKGDQPESESRKSTDSPPDDTEQPSNSTHQSEQARDQQQDSTSAPPSSSPGEIMSQISSGLGSLIKLLIVLALSAVVAWFAWSNWERCMLWLRSLLNADSPEAAAMDDSWVAERRPPPRPFSSYKNPIGSESDPRRVVVITFQAYEAWARERGASREKDETPSEFAYRAARVVPDLGRPVADVVQAYNRIVYGRGKATSKDIEAASQVWQRMR